MSITTKDLAKACGVSRTTVTRALSGTKPHQRRNQEPYFEYGKRIGLSAPIFLPAAWLKEDP